MAKMIVVQVPAGTPIDKMSQDEIKGLVEQTMKLHQTLARDVGSVVLHTSGQPMKAIDNGPWVSWTRACN